MSHRRRPPLNQRPGGFQWTATPGLASSAPNFPYPTPLREPSLLLSQDAPHENVPPAFPGMRRKQRESMHPAASRSPSNACLLRTCRRVLLQGFGQLLSPGPNLFARHRVPTSHVSSLLLSDLILRIPDAFYLGAYSSL